MLEPVIAADPQAASIRFERYHSGRRTRARNGMTLDKSASKALLSDFAELAQPEVPGSSCLSARCRFAGLRFGL